MFPIQKLAFKHFFFKSVDVDVYLCSLSLTIESYYIHFLNLFDFSVLPEYSVDNSNDIPVPMSSQNTDKRFKPMTFTRSPVDKHTSFPESSYTDPEK